MAFSSENLGAGIIKLLDVIGANVTVSCSSTVGESKGQLVHDTAIVSPVTTWFFWNFFLWNFIFSWQKGQKEGWQEIRWEETVTGQRWG